MQYNECGMNKSFESLHVINKSAKKYDLDGSTKSIYRKNALYTLKHRAINQWVDHFSDVEMHIIDGNKHYYFVSNNWSFHIPEDKLYVDVDYSGDIKTIDNFDPGVETTGTDLSEKNALRYLNNEHRLNPNKFIQDKKFGWDYLY